MLRTSLRAASLLVLLPLTFACGNPSGTAADTSGRDEPPPTASWPATAAEPEEASLTWPSGADTAGLDPLAGDVGGEAGLGCISYPTPGTTVTQGEHQSTRSIDLDCSKGDPLTNPFPAQAKVTQVVTRYSGTHCYDSVAAYNEVCSSSQNPSASAACNNLIVIETTIAGVTWKVSMLHISGTTLSVGDVVAPGEQIATCGNIGWSCGGQYSDGSHLHLSLHGGTPGAWHYPGDWLSSSCAPISSSATCTPGTTCCGSDGKYVRAGSAGPECQGDCHSCNGAGACTDVCARSCPSGEGAYCGGPVGLDPGKLYDCRGGSFTVLETCSNGCKVESAGTADRCESGSVTPAPTTPPPAPTTPPPSPTTPPPPPPASCPSGNGLYCGSTVGKSVNTLYNCQNGTYATQQVCANGCVVAPPGSPDYCASAPAPSTCPSGNGLYCGSTVGKSANTLYNCQNGSYTTRQVCPTSCVVAPPGTPDYCR